MILWALLMKQFCLMKTNLGMCFLKMTTWVSSLNSKSNSVACLWPNDTAKKIVLVSYCWKKNNHKFSNLKQYTSVIQFLWIWNLGMTYRGCASGSVIWVQSRCWARDGVLSEGLMRKDPLSTHMIVGRISVPQRLLIRGPQILASCWP